jgi:hypothetical protein
LTVGRRARVSLAIEELDQLAVKYTGRFYDPSLLDTYLELERFGSIDRGRPAKGTMRCWSHGDLHCHNVLVHGREEPVLIDAANIESMHWASDPARLSVDILIGSLEAGHTSHEWSRMEYWLACAEAFFKRSVDQLTDPTPTGAALRWIAENVDRMCDRCWSEGTKWEWFLALGVELLRASYRQTDLPTPKRVLALAAACMALREAESQFTAAHGAAFN